MSAQGSNDSMRVFARYFDQDGRARMTFVPLVSQPTIFK
jgi:hypothetical protein